MKRLAVLAALAIILSGFAMAQTEYRVGEDESKIFTVDGESHNLTLMYVDGGAAINLDGEETELGEELQEGDTFTSNGVTVRAESFDYNPEYLNFTVVSEVPMVCNDGGVDYCDSEKPADPDGDGSYEDIDGDGDADSSDVRVFGYVLPIENASTEMVGYYDFNEDGKVDYKDVRSLQEEVAPNNPIGFQKEEDDWRDNQGHYDNFNWDLANPSSSYVGIDDVITHWGQHGREGEYNVSENSRLAKLDYNCDGVVNRTDSNALFHYAVNLGDSKFADECEFETDEDTNNTVVKTGESEIEIEFEDGMISVEGSYVAPTAGYEMGATVQRNNSEIDVMFEVQSPSQNQIVAQVITPMEKEEKISVKEGRYDVNATITVDGELVEMKKKKLGRIDYDFDNKVNVTKGDVLYLGNNDRILEIKNVASNNAQDIVRATYNEAGLGIDSDGTQLSSSSNYQAYLCNVFVKDNEEYASIVVSDSLSCDDVSDDPNPPPKDPGNDTDTYEIELNRGWNMVSLPEGADTNLNSVCDLSDFNGQSFWSLMGQDWQLSSGIENPMKGYLVFARSKCETELVPSPSSGGNSMTLVPGWNTVSVPESMSLSDVETNCEWESSRIWTLDAEYLRWNTLNLDEELDPTQGYYVKAGSQCSIAW